VEGRFLERLLAKSDGTTLPEHVKAVLEVSGELLSPSHGILRQFGLCRWAEDARAALLRAAMAHDLGKAGEPHQHFLRRRIGPEKLPIPHELVSVWLITTVPPLGEWLFHGVTTLARVAALAAVAAHHVRLSQIKIDVRPGWGPRVRVFAGHADFGNTLNLAAHLFGPPPRLGTYDMDLASPGVAGVEAALLRAQQEWDSLDGEGKKFVAVIKALLAAADGQGSAWRTGAREIVRGKLQCVLDGSELGRVVSRALAGGSGGSREPRDFQRKTAASPGRVVLLEAGCGSGKTAAAYLWAESKARGRRLFFCYPTTGTASEGFRGILHGVFADDENPGLLVHSRALVDIADMADANEADPLELADLWASLGVWDRPLVVCTADQVLGIIQNYRRPLYAMPALAQAAFVFDEIHLYDGRMFGALVRFLQTFCDAPCLLMTATLQPERREVLRDAMREHILRRVPGPAEHELLPRYRIVDIDEAEARARVARALGEGKRVLWVANTVSRAIDAWRSLESSRGSGMSLPPYHSRFRYGDGVTRRKLVLNAFRSSRGVFAATTQVCEVSLDLSSDLLVTERCPVPSLIQRLGRLNRYAHPGDPPGEALVINPPGPEPYSRESLDQCVEWMRAFVGRTVSQRDLMDSMPRGSAVMGARSEWIDGGICATSSPLRDPGLTVEVLREEDVAQEWIGKSGRWRTGELVSLQKSVIPMLFWPVRSELSGWKRVRGYYVAPRGRIAYDAAVGARWVGADEARD
jgi:CRISPR-associated endonuclease/helicase Cas3